MIKIKLHISSQYTSRSCTVYMVQTRLFNLWLQGTSPYRCTCINDLLGYNNQMSSWEILRSDWSHE